MNRATIYTRFVYRNRQDEIWRTNLMHWDITKARFIQIWSILQKKRHYIVSISEIVIYRIICYNSSYK